ncbi:MAG: DnaJ domain-containing protein [Myxococcota bacterium]
MAVRVLAVSDSHFERSLLLSVLPSAHCAITLVDGADAASRSIKQVIPDLMVMTTAFAVAVGRVFFQGLPVPVLLLSRRTSDEEGGTRYALVQSVVCAPFDRVKLLDAIQELVDHPDHTPPKGVPVATTGPDPYAELRHKVDALFRQIAALDNYAILGVARNAGMPDIMMGYRQRLADFHPDRLTATGDVGLQEQAGIICKRVNAAFQTLSRPDTRRAYDTWLHGQGSVAPAPPARPLTLNLGEVASTGHGPAGKP